MGKYQLDIKNRGIVPVSGLVTMTYEDKFVDFVEATPLESAAGQGQIMFDLLDMAPSTELSFQIILKGTSINILHKKGSPIN